MEASLTFKDLVDFVVENKKDKCFIGYDLNSIISLLKECLGNGTLLYNINASGKIDGMILAEIREEQKVLFVTENLSMCLRTLRTFARVAKERWPDYKLEWLKRNIHKQHNTRRIYEKLAA